MLSYYWATCWSTCGLHWATCWSTCGLLLDHMLVYMWSITGPHVGLHVVYYWTTCWSTCGLLLGHMLVYMWSFTGPHVGLHVVYYWTTCCSTCGLLLGHMLVYMWSITGPHVGLHVVFYWTTCWSTCGLLLDRLLLVVRYTNRLRIVIPSASLCRSEWDKAVQFGWYCDFPVRQNSETGTTGDIIFFLFLCCLLGWHKCATNTMYLRVSRISAQRYSTIPDGYGYISFSQFS